MPSCKSVSWKVDHDGKFTKSRDNDNIILDSYRYSQDPNKTIPKQDGQGIIGNDPDTDITSGEKISNSFINGATSDNELDSGIPGHEILTVEAVSDYNDNTIIRNEGLFSCHGSKRITDESNNIRRSEVNTCSLENFALHETPEELKQRKRSHLVVYATVFVMTTGFSLSLIGVWPYLELLDPTLSKTTLGWVIAANPLGQLIASPVVGYLGNKIGSIRVICYCTLLLFIVGNLIYAFLPLMNDYWYHSAFHIMLISKFIVGLSSSNITLCRSYMASSTTVLERTLKIAILSAAQSLGFIVGPALQTVLVVSIDADMLKYRSCGWLAAIFGVVNLFLVTPHVFKEFNIAEKEEMLRKKSANVDTPPENLKPDVAAVAGILISYFFSMLIFIFMETLSVPLLTDQYAWEDGVAVVVVGVLTLLSGVLALVMVFAIRKLVKKYDERKLIVVIGFIPIALGTFLYMPIYTNQPIIISNCTTVANAQNLNFSQDDNSMIFPLFLTKLYSNSFAGIGDTFQQYDSSTDVNETLVCSPGCPESQEWCQYVSRIPFVQFGIANILIIIGLPVVTALSLALYSKALGRRPQGLWMALVAEILSVARFIGPIAASYLYTNFGTVVSFGALTCGMIIGLVSYVAVQSRLPLTVAFSDQK